MPDVQGNAGGGSKRDPYFQGAFMQKQGEINKHSFILVDQLAFDLVVDGLYLIETR